jgi:hypothetical protein
VAARDFDLDGRVDFLWQDPVAGTLALSRTLSNPILGSAVAVVSTLVSAPLSGGVPDTAQVVTGDYDGDGWPDLLVRYAGGELSIIYLRRGVARSSAWLPGAVDDEYRTVLDSVDTDGSGGDEIVLRHGVTGEVSIVDPTDPRLVTGFVLLTPGGTWRAIGITDS